MTFADFDGDGEDEMLVMTPFHGDTIKIYKKADGKYTCVKTFEGSYEFLHGIWGAEILGKGMAIIGNRKGDRDLMACYHDGKDYVLEVLDHNVRTGKYPCIQETGQQAGYPVHQP